MILKDISQILQAALAWLGRAKTRWRLRGWVGEGLCSSPGESKAQTVREAPRGEEEGRFKAKNEQVGLIHNNIKVILYCNAIARGEFLESVHTSNMILMQNCVAFSLVLLCNSSSSSRPLDACPFE